MMRKTPKLEKCLHCGGEGTFNYRDIPNGMEGHFKDWWVECKSCGWHSKHYDQYIRSKECCIELAAESWNTRADGWIPCSDHLPPKPEFAWQGYLVQSRTVVEPYSAYWNGKWWEDVFGDEVDVVIAWQPLPEPYKGEVT